MAFHRVQGRRALLGSAAVVAATAPSLAAPPPRGGATPTPPCPAASAFSPFDYRKPTVGGPLAGVTFAPAVRQPSAAGDLVGFNFNAGSRSALPAQQGGFGQVFAPGQVQATDGLACEHSGSTHPVQMVPLATYVSGETADPAHVGSVKHALLVKTLPRLAANASIPALLKRGTAPSGAAVTIAPGDLSGWAGTFTLTRARARDTYVANPGFDASRGETDRYYPTANRREIRRLGAAFLTSAPPYDISPATMLGLSAPQVRFAGPLATGVRCIRDIPSTAIRVILDIRKHADGSLVLDYQVRADKQRWPNPNDLQRYDVAMQVTQGGAAAYSYSCEARADGEYAPSLIAG